MINGHGDDTHNYNGKILSNFSSNVYARQDMSALDRHLCSVIQSIHSYPEPDAHSLARLLADKNGIGIDTICVTNGATEAIYLIAQAFRGSRTAIVVPTFSEYEDACSIHGHKIQFCENLEYINSGVQLVWLCNPNNPNGTVYDIRLLKKTLEQNPDTCFVFDQSYEYFTNKPVLTIEEASRFKNIILLHSMTKQYAIPGLRLGYITAHKDMMGKIKPYRMPWSVNQLAIEAGKFLLNNGAKTIKTDEYLKITKHLHSQLSEIEGLTVHPTDTHFFLCKLQNGKASELKSYLAKNYGILIRDAANFRGLDETFFRLATQSSEENNSLVKAIEEWMQSV